MATIGSCSVRGLDSTIPDALFSQAVDSSVEYALRNELLFMWEEKRLDSVKSFFFCVGLVDNEALTEPPWG